MHITPSLSDFFMRIIESAINPVLVRRAISLLLRAKIEIPEFIAMIEDARRQRAPPGIAEKIHNELVLCPDYLSRHAASFITTTRRI